MCYVYCTRVHDVYTRRGHKDACAVCTHWLVSARCVQPAIHAYAHSYVSPAHLEHFLSSVDVETWLRCGAARRDALRRSNRASSYTDSNSRICKFYELVGQSRYALIRIFFQIGRFQRRVRRDDFLDTKRFAKRRSTCEIRNVNFVDARVERGDLKIRRSQRWKYTNESIVPLIEFLPL